MQLRLGHDRRKHPDVYEFRPMTFEEAAALRYGDRVWFLAADGSARGIKVNGTPKRWKTRPRDVRIPLKYGMYEHGYTQFRDGESSGETLLVLVDENVNIWP